MKTLLCMILLVSPVGNIVTTQTIYSVTPDTKGNTIELTVANVLANAPAEDVKVSVVRHSAYVSFASSERTVKNIPPTQNAAVTLTFDVARSAPANKQDTLEFRITDKSGSVWVKSVIVQYAGPSAFALDQNFPNPFNPTTKIQYQLPIESSVTLTIYDLLGREVERLVNEQKPAGYFGARWDAANVASGVYFYRMDARPLNGTGGFQQIKKLMVVK